MARIAGVDLPRNKRMEIALTYVYGIGRSAALKICAEAQVEPARKSDDRHPLTLQSKASGDDDLIATPVLGPIKGMISTSQHLIEADIGRLQPGQPHTDGHPQRPRLGVDR